MQLDNFSNGQVLSLLYDQLSIGDSGGRGHIGFAVMDNNGYLGWGRHEGFAINFNGVSYIGSMRAPLQQQPAINALTAQLSNISSSALFRGIWARDYLQH